MAFYTYEAEGRVGSVVNEKLAYHDECCPEPIRHGGDAYCDGTIGQAPGWIWAPWFAGYPCQACGKPC
jgi:hypothetical protein